MLPFIIPISKSLSLTAFVLRGDIDLEFRIAHEDGSSWFDPSNYSASFSATPSGGFAFGLEFELLSFAFGGGSANNVEETFGRGDNFGFNFGWVKGTGFEVSLMKDEEGNYIVSPEGKGKMGAEDRIG